METIGIALHTDGPGFTLVNNPTEWMTGRHLWTTDDGIAVVEYVCNINQYHNKSQAINNAIKSQVELARKIQGDLK